MKKLLIALLIACLVLSLVACSGTKDNTDDPEDKLVETSDENGDEAGEGGEDGDAETGEASFDYEKEDLSKYVKLGEYKGLKATKQSDVLTEEEYIDYMNSLLSSYTANENITDRPIAEGDTVILDYSGSMEGEDFAGGTALGVEVIAAEGTGYIPGFASAIIGHNPGETFSADVVFPEDYKNSEYAGKNATFTYTIHYIKGEEYVPTLDNITDAFVQQYFDMGSVDEFLAYQREGIEMQKSYSVISAMNMELWQQVVDNAEVIEYPEGTVEETYQQYREMYEYYASYYGTDYDAFLTDYVGITDDELMEECKAMVKENLVLYSMTKELDADVTDAEVEGKIAFFAQLHGVSSEEVISYYGEESMRSTALFDKLLSIIASYGEITEAE